MSTGIYPNNHTNPHFNLKYVCREYPLPDSMNYIGTPQQVSSVIIQKAK